MIDKRENKKQDKTTHFGYQEIPFAEKAQRVTDVFSSVANQYDIMNDLMSLGIHRLWKRTAIMTTQARAGHAILDLAGGTGDLSKLLNTIVGSKGKLILADLTYAMLSVGREKLTNNGVVGNIDYIQANAETLPFKNNYFDRIIMGFGLRNVTDKNKALRSMFQVLKPGGKLVILEFSKPVIPWLNPLYDAYSFHVLPKLGKLIAKDADSYQYLAESIRMHPDQKTLQCMMEEAGFEQCGYQNLSAGIVAIHHGMKF